MDVNFTDFYELVNPVFWEFFDDTESRIRISFGGAGSGKSFCAFQEVIYRILSEPGHNYLICRKIHATNKTSTYALMIQLINLMGLSHLFKVNKTDMTFTVKETGYMIVFKGLDDIEKIKSFTFPQGILTDIVIEEASEITQGDFNQLNVRLRGKRLGEQSPVNFQITLLLNPIINTHWIKREFIDLKSYQKRSKVNILKTTYLDNNFIDEDYRDVLEGYKDIDYEFYKVYCLGMWGQFGNIIFNNWQSLKCPYQPEDFDTMTNGMDFGSVHPSLIVKSGFKDGNLYSYNELTAFDSTNKEFIDANKEYNVLFKHEKCIADSAEPSRIKEWVQNGFSVVGAIKGKDSVSRGIDYMKSFKWYIDSDKCPRLYQEVQMYKWKEDKNGDAIEGKPVDIMDDAIKSVMYGLEPWSRSQGKPTVLSGTKSDRKKEVLKALRDQRRSKREVMKSQRKKKREQELEKKKLSGEVIHETENNS